MSPRVEVTFDLDDAPATSRVERVGGGNYLSFHLSFRSGASEVRFDASSIEDIESLLDQAIHDLMVHKASAA